MAESKGSSTETKTAKTVLAVDPGKSKCGLAVLRGVEAIVYREVIPRGEFSIRFRDLYSEYQPQAVVVGDSTGSEAISTLIAEVVGRPPHMVDERHSTEQAKIRYFRENPPRGLWRLIPVGLQTPPVCYDDYAAVVLGERWLGAKSVAVQ